MSRMGNNRGVIIDSGADTNLLITKAALTRKQLAKKGAKTFFSVGRLEGVIEEGGGGPVGGLAFPFFFFIP